MAVSAQKILLLGVVVPAVCYIFYNDLLLFTVDGEVNAVEKAVQNAIIKSRRTDLELSNISDYHCPWERYDEERIQEDSIQENKEVRTLHCTASAEFTNGTSADVSGPTHDQKLANLSIIVTFL